MIMRICRAPVLKDVLAFIVTRPSLQPGMFEFVVSKSLIPGPILEKYRSGTR